MKIKNSVFLLLFCLLCANPTLSLFAQKQSIVIGKTYTGKVISVFDGDTYALLLSDSTLLHIRMDAIDAPEKGMPYYRVAKNYLFELIGNKTVSCNIKDIDRNKRYIGRTFVMAQDISKLMLAAGLAWHYKQFNNEENLAEAEAHAKQNRIGMWTENKFIAPWIVRKYRRDGYSDAQFRQMMEANDDIIKKYIP